MELIYRPTEDGKPADPAAVRRWPFTLGRFRAREIEEIERLTALAWGVPYKQALMQGSMLARRALLWTLQRREHPKLRFSDLDPCDDEIEITLNLDEWAELRAEVEGAKHLSQADREQALAQIDKSIEDTRAELEAKGEAPPAAEAEGKAPSAS